ncbi:hypothetical protein LR48_Vigan09g219500 [Vigna angularis]|uniref:PORR domain-containing protein n=1 Tax=Phaseolus angularis TaxID=3914 RepID=A0A0L9VEQ9_PHAAN|nr:hypothetical protein LR48_Vigan09g219500 [Vigna angularis]
MAQPNDICGGISCLHRWKAMAGIYALSEASSSSKMNQVNIRESPISPLCVSKLPLPPMSQPSATRFLLLLSRRTPTRNRPPPPYQQRHHLRTIFDGTFKPVRDRGLDHAVEREKSLKPLISLKTLIKREPSKSLPLSLIKSTLHFPFRPIEFIRKYPSVFEEFLPTPTILQPHIRLTPETLHLDAEEQLVYQSHQFKHQLSNRLLKFLMIARIHKIPLPLIEHLRWDLGLPDDYTETVVPEFSDYFRVADGFLELVCWSHELAVSVIQNRNKKDEFDGQLVFPVQFSTGFEMDKKYDGEDDDGSGEGSKGFSNWVYVIFLSAGYFSPFFLLP